LEATRAKRISTGVIKRLAAGVAGDAGVFVEKPKKWN